LHGGDFVPSADETTPCHVAFDALVVCQLAPELVGTQTGPSLMATSLTPSAEQATAVQGLFGALVFSQD
jgi:hypothetical protein